MSEHEGVGVLPGRYAGETRSGSTRADAAADRACRGEEGGGCAGGSDRGGGRVVGAGSATLLELVGEFDATNAVRFWTDVKSLAHWLAWSCSMTLPDRPGACPALRGHCVGCRRWPRRFEQGRLSYSKVREVTRVVDVIEETQLCELAFTATAAQLAVMISAFRTAEGRRWPQQTRRRLHLIEREDGMVDLRVRLPKDEAATIAAALAAATDQFGSPPPKPATGTEPSEDSSGTDLHAGRCVARCGPRLPQHRG